MTRSLEEMRTGLKGLTVIPPGIAASPKRLVLDFPLTVAFPPPSFPTGLRSQSELQETKAEGWQLYRFAKLQQEDCGTNGGLLCAGWFLTC